MRSVKSVMEHNGVGDRHVGESPMLDLLVRRLIFIGDAHAC